MFKNDPDLSSRPGMTKEQTAYEIAKDRYQQSQNNNAVYELAKMKVKKAYPKDPLTGSSMSWSQYNNLLRRFGGSSGPPGPPPRPGLQWKPSTHRWILPKE